MEATKQTYRSYRLYLRNIQVSFSCIRRLVEENYTIFDTRMSIPYIASKIAKGEFYKTTKKSTRLSYELADKFHFYESHYQLAKRMTDAIIEKYPINPFKPIE